MILSFTAISSPGAAWLESWRNPATSCCIRSTSAWPWACLPYRLARAVTLRPMSCSICWPLTEKSTVGAILRSSSYLAAERPPTMIRSGRIRLSAS
jgi:hypothetical protein